MVTVMLDLAVAYTGNLRASSSSPGCPSSTSTMPCVWAENLFVPMLRSGFGPCAEMGTG